jgi:hypothetical protein
MGIFDVFKSDPHAHVKRAIIKRWLAAIQFPDHLEEQPFQDPHYYSDCELEAHSDTWPSSPKADSWDRDSPPPPITQPPESPPTQQPEPAEAVVRYTPMSQTFDYGDFQISVTDWKDPFDQPDGPHLSYEISPYAGAAEEGEYGEYTYSLKPINDKPSDDELSQSEPDSDDDHGNHLHHPQVISRHESFSNFFIATASGNATASASSPGLTSVGVSSSLVSDITRTKLMHPVTGTAASSSSSAPRIGIAVVKRDSRLAFVRPSTRPALRRVCLVTVAVNTYQQCKREKEEEKRKRKRKREGKGEGEGKGEREGEERKGKVQAKG